MGIRTIEQNREVIIYGVLAPNSHEYRYVGKTVNLKDRIKSHKCDAFKFNTHKSRWFRKIYASGGLPEFEVLEVVPPGGDWEEAERRWIAYFRSFGLRLLNTTDGGDGCCGLYQTPETRAKISAAFKGRVFTTEHLAKIAAARKGWKASQENKENMSKARKGIPLSEEHKAKMVESQRARRLREKEERALQSHSKGAIT